MTALMPLAHSNMQINTDPNGLLSLLHIKMKSIEFNLSVSIEFAINFTDILRYIYWVILSYYTVNMVSIGK